MLNPEIPMTSFDTQTIEDYDPELWAAIAAEQKRQETHIELIASENHTTPHRLPQPCPAGILL